MNAVITPQLTALGPEGLLVRDIRGRDRFVPRARVSEVVEVTRPAEREGFAPLRAAVVRDHDGRAQTTFLEVFWDLDEVAAWARAGGLSHRAAGPDEEVLLGEPFFHPDTLQALKIVVGTIVGVLVLGVLLSLVLSLR